MSSASLQITHCIVAPLWKFWLVRLDRKGLKKPKHTFFEYKHKTLKILLG